ncbi:sortase domain-bontaining protein [Streptomyces sp. NPDC048612]|uniref:sortase domain-containing protein n=1 Tax=Streptomyces sp. NPDC048612 TaxID=3365579 RepID=UPI0037209218
MSADEDGRTGAVGVTARPDDAGPGGGVRGMKAADLQAMNAGGVPGTKAGVQGTHVTRGLGGVRTAPKAFDLLVLPGSGLGGPLLPGTDTGTCPGPDRDTGRAPASAHAAVPDPTRENAPTRRPAQLLAGVAWAVLLLGLWMWGHDLADGVAAQFATTGDVAAAGRPLGRQAPPHAHAPVPAAPATRPVGISVDALGVRGAGITGQDLDEDGVLAPPPYTSPAPVGWYAAGPQPGEAGAALLVAGPGADRGADARRTAFHRLTRLKPGARLDIRRADGSTARFTVEDVQLYDRHRFDPRKAYAAHDRGRSELRLITEDRSSAPASARHGGDPGNVIVVSAYLTDYQEPPHTGNG